MFESCGSCVLFPLRLGRGLGAVVAVVPVDIDSGAILMSGVLFEVLVVVVAEQEGSCVELYFPVSSCVACVAVV